MINFLMVVALLLILVLVVWHLVYGIMCYDSLRGWKHIIPYWLEERIFWTSTGLITLSLVVIFVCITYIQMNRPKNGDQTWVGVPLQKQLTRLI